MTYNYKIIARIYGEGSKFTMATFLSLDARLNASWRALFLASADPLEHCSCARLSISAAVLQGRQSGTWRHFLGSIQYASVDIST